MTAAAIEPGRLMCSGCIHPRYHPGITHAPLGSPAWCSWTACGDNVHVGQETCTANHHTDDTEPHQEGTPVSDDTTQTPPVKKAAPKKAATAPPAPPTEPVLSPAQQARVAALKEAGDLLKGMEFGSFDLLEVARFIVGDPIDHHDDGDDLTFTGPTPTEGDKQ